MADAAKPDKLTLGEALKDLGWFPILFAVAVGGPSILSIIESVLVDHQLVPALQWIVDGYNRIMAVLGAAVEPLVQPAIDWVNARFGWELVLDPVWRPVFGLMMAFFIPMIRALLKSGIFGIVPILGGSVGILAVLAVALCLGLFATGSGWVTQGIVAAAPFAAVMFLSALVHAAWGRWAEVRESARIFTGSSIMLFAFAAGLSFVPGLASSAGVFTIGGVVMTMGLVTATAGLAFGNRIYSRVGLTVLGGFATAGLILAADWSLKALGAG
jgi:hypothetical protein